MTRIELLYDTPSAIPILAQWFVEEWRPWYGPDCGGDAEADLLACRNHDRLPLAVIALNDEGQVLGTAALKNDALGSEFGYNPWLAAMLVGRRYRGAGIGSLLVSAIEHEARRLGLSVIFASTYSVASILTRRGWTSTGEKTQSLRDPVSIYRLDL